MSPQDLQCPFCPKTSSRGTGLASHIRGAHPKQYAGWSKARKGGPTKRGRTKPGSAPMPAIASVGSFNEIVASLEKQRDAIESALIALRAVGGATVTNQTPGRKRGRPRKVS